MIFKAIQFAAEKHSGQFRKGTNIPYMYHLMNVMKLLCDFDCTDEVITAGILHDVLEDTATTTEELERHFGKEVTSIVINDSEANKSLPWKTRKEITIQELNTTPLSSLYVAFADKFDNITAIDKDYTSIGEPFWSRFNAQKKEQLWYYSSLYAIFSNRLTSRNNQIDICLNKMKAILERLMLS
ncbi:bifunctional (p)ppGpp synthetase/guanosine-3',5'-bis(diphosphate) 3'-pyrophosphohydrolase [Flammeovirga pectinis]|uniref:Bifunctional (P)ppGpp synthetase/guanosine-3',5'-bis(Diphosphate) 3'-pyrophosphohydrolase n=1 Tax=Flammeovirga pectinis TaxID=2494373 RepID=A0A3S9PB25_9BACT|nr:HD domain-containing protein [Flammeovirga pectinis]AZQ65313.1 bifunctional (p)ppGpp synthetase/guanosine-3',5'-bis(diphosphate) 3'-pyrophosphohydrolase [Flammeovirga pectinis]